MDPATARRLERIHAARPFRDRLSIARVEPVGAESAHSGTAFFVTDPGGRRYKLRDCGHRTRAAVLAHWIGLLPDVFPRLLGRDGRFLLLEVLEDYRPVTRVELIFAADRLGRIGAELHRAGASHGPLSRAVRAAVGARLRARFRADLAIIARSGIVPLETVEGARRKARAHRRRFGVPVALELDDLHKGNWLLRESDGALRYVDEEAVGLRQKGAGLASLLKTATRTHTWELYREGYASVANASFITMAYTEALLLQDTVRRVAHKVRTEARPEKLPEEVAHLRALADTEALSVAWRFPKGDDGRGTLP